MATIPRILTLEERKALLYRQVKKHDVANIMLHWFNVACWVFLLSTGLGILISPFFRVIPENWNVFIRNAFGGLANLRQFHKAIGLLWVFVLTYNVVLGFRKYFGPFGRESIWLTRDDLEWLRMQPLRILGKRVMLPPQDAYNAGQKLYAIAITLGTVGLMVTGLIMTFPRYIPARWIVQWANPLHFLSWGSVIAALIVHVYMGAVMPEERAAFFSMFTGKVNGLYAYMHHYKWLQRKQQEEVEWEVRMQAHIEEEEALLQPLVAGGGTEAIQ